MAVEAPAGDGVDPVPKRAGGNVQDAGKRPGPAREHNTLGARRAECRAVPPGRQRQREANGAGHIDAGGNIMAIRVGAAADERRAAIGPPLDGEEAGRGDKPAAHGGEKRAAVPVHVSPHRWH